MSVYKRAGKDTYSFDFVVRGRRFSGDTGSKTKREAERFEAGQREGAKALIAEQSSFFSSTMTFEVASSRWWLEVGQHHKNSETTLRSLDWLKLHIGATTPLPDITDSIVASLVARRRGEHIKGNPKLAFVSPATVNRTCTQPLREIITRAKKVWEDPNNPNVRRYLRPPLGREKPPPRDRLHVRCGKDQKERKIDSRYALPSDRERIEDRYAPRGARRRRRELSLPRHAPHGGNTHPQEVEFEGSPNPFGALGYQDDD
jgi:hypothetical protein